MKPKQKIPLGKKGFKKEKENNLIKEQMTTEWEKEAQKGELTMSIKENAL